MNGVHSRSAFLAILALITTVSSPPADAAPFHSAVGTSKGAACERLTQLALPDAKVTVAQSVPAGGFSGPPAPFTGLDLSIFYKSLPAFCRAVVEAHPTSDSNIKIETWMPSAGWNGKLRGFGNGGFAGLIDYPQLGTAVSHGYASTATDTGHSGSPVDATWALGHPEKVTDFGYRGIHEMTRIAKAVIHAFYGSSPLHSYFAGCSDGGREALMEAQRYPEDYDGILAGAPANFWTALLAMSAWDSQALTLDPASYIPGSKMPVIAAAVVAACDDRDGVRDEILNDPRECHFNPGVLLCKSEDAPDKCLTQPQIAALEKIYDGPRNSHGRSVFPGYLPGAEEGPGGWATWITGPAAKQSLMFLFANGYFSYMVYEKPDWDYKTFNLEPALKAAEDKTALALNATNADLRPFQSRGGKLILYHGWDDPAISAVNTIDYYNSVATKLGQQNVDSFVRLYMVPGMQHCAGGPGADSFGQDGTPVPDDPQHSVHLALERWVENGAAPSTIVASKYADKGPARRVKMTRPLCAYPQLVKYQGAGDTNDAASFVCVRGKK